MFEVSVVLNFHGSLESPSAEEFDANSIDDAWLGNELFSISSTGDSVSGFCSIFSVGQSELIDLFWELIWEGF